MGDGRRAAGPVAVAYREQGSPGLIPARPPGAKNWGATTIEYRIEGQWQMA